MIKRSEWITNAMVKSINTKNERYKKLQKDPGNEEEELIKKNKADFYKKKLFENSDCPNRLWKCMESLKNRNKSKEQQTKQIISNSGQIIEEPSEMAGAFLEHYASIGKEFAEDCKHDPTFSSPQTYMENSIYISETDEVEVGGIIKTL
ncbi:hypothetical protein JTB14_028023 [Gonioctena quinquepunctata]|nr:hypothetical protein JTB14_028023 [Gonioctena quinquepunctata]